MTTLSGTANFQLTRNELVAATLRGLGVIGLGDLPEPEDFTNCAQAMNLLVKAWHTMGIQLWTTQPFVITPSVGRRTYTLGPGGGVVFAATTVAGTTPYTVAPTVTFSAPGGSGTTATGTVALLAGSPGGIAITITSGGTQYTAPPTAILAGGVGGAGVTAFARLNGVFLRRPLRILDGALLRYTSGGNDTPLTQIDRVSYLRLGLKSTLGQPNEYYYDPQIDNGILYVHPVAASATTYTLHFDYQSPLQDVNLSTENIDFPQEWFQAFKWGVMDELGTEYGLSETMLARNERKATLYREGLSSWDGAQDNTAVFFGASQEYSSGGR